MNSIKRLLKRVPFTKKEIVILSVLIVFSFFLRMFLLHENLFFGYEQGRDLLKVKDLLHGDVILLGPKTDIDGVFHGALSYYILVPFYLISFGSPYGILSILIFLHCISGVFLYSLVREHSDKLTATIAALLFAVSYPIIIYSRWLSNPNLVVPITIILFFSLFRAQKHGKYLVLTSVAFGLLIHLQIAVAVLLTIPIVFLGIKNRSYTRKTLVAAIFTLILILLPYFIFEFKNNFLMTHSFIHHFQEPKTEVTLRSKTLEVFYDQLTDFFFIERRELSLVMLIGSAIYAAIFLRKNKLAIFSLFTVFLPPALFYITNFNPLRHFYNAEPIFIIILLSLVLGSIYKRNKFIATILVSIFVFSNLRTYKERIPENVANFLYHAQRMYLSDEKNVIDFAYAKAQGQAFSYDYYSIPYWKSEAWEYLFDWYGVSKYGYRPVADRTKTFYVFMEPDESQPIYQKNWYEGLNKESTVVTSFKSRHLTVEERLKTK